jgi:hypothetical protein
MLRPTGPGRVIDNPNPQLNPGGRYDLWKFLANFDIDGDDLKPAFASWLDQNLGQPRGRWVFLRGWASRTGTPDHNKSLSERRVRRVREYLVQHGFPPTHITGCDYVGEAWSSDGPEEDWTHRCVEVIVSPDRLNPPRPPHVIDVDATGISGRLARHFRIRVLGSLQAGAAVAGNGILFEIWDTTYQLACQYGYVGLGIGASVPGPHLLERAEQMATALNVGTSLAGHSGHWHYFHTRAHVDVDNFGGPRCSFLQVDHGGRNAHPGMTEAEYQNSLAGRVDRALFTPYFEFFADPLGPAHQRISVRVDLPSEITEGVPSAILTGGSLFKIRGPYRRTGP